jgi:hypothetical protein
MLLRPKGGALEDITNSSSNILVHNIFHKFFRTSLQQPGTKHLMLIEDLALADLLIPRKKLHLA